MFNAIKEWSLWLEVYAIDYVESIGAIGIGLATVTCIYHLVANGIKNIRAAEGASKSKEEDMVLRLIAGVSAAYTLPVGPALGLSAFYPDLLGKIDGSQPAMLIAASILLWSNIKSL